MAFILLYVALAMSLFIVRDISYQIAVAAALSFSLMFLPFRRVRSGFIPIFLFLVFTFCGNLFFHSGKILYGSGFFSITDEGIAGASLRTLRVFSMIYGAKILTFLLSLEKVVQELDRLFSPLGKIGIPVKEFFLIMGLTVKSFPLLSRHLSASFVEFRRQNDGKGFRDRMRKLVSFMIPVFTESIRSPEVFFAPSEGIGEAWELSERKEER